jgi:phage terminase large subunit GpA-like protein
MATKRMSPRAIKLREAELDRQVEETPKRRFQSHFPEHGFTCPNCDTYFRPGSMAMQDELTGQDWCMVKDTCRQQKEDLRTSTRESRKAQADAFIALLEAGYSR